MAEVSIEAEAALLVAVLQADLEPTLEQQAKEPTPPPPSLQEILMKTFENNADDFLPLKEQFTKFPGAILERVIREGGPQWRDPQFVDMMATENTRHLSLTLNPCKKDFDLNDVETDLTCDKIVERCNSSLRSLEIHCLPCQHPEYSKGKPKEDEYNRPGLSVAQLCGVLRRLKNVTELDLREMQETNHSENALDMIISHLALNNPHVEIVYLPFLTAESRTTITTRWPELKILHAYDTSFDSGDLEKMANLTNDTFSFKSTLLLALAKAHDPATNSPYKQGGWLSCEDICVDYFSSDFSSDSSDTSSDLTDTSMSLDSTEASADTVRNMNSIFTAFPNLNSLDLRGCRVPDLCTSLAGRENVHITELNVSDALGGPLILAPLLALIGHDIRELGVRDDWSVVDLAMVGHYCPNLENLCLEVYNLEAAVEYEVTDTTFSQLKDLRVEIFVEGGARLPNPLVVRLLGGPFLEKVYIQGLTVPEAVFESLLVSEQGEDEQRSLGSIKEFTVNYQLTSTATFAGLLARMPRLIELDLLCDEPLVFQMMSGVESVESRAYDRKSCVLKSFCSQSGLKVKIDAPYDASYVLKWKRCWERRRNLDCGSSSPTTSSDAELG